jgi:hypothetical protein
MPDPILDPTGRPAGRPTVVMAPRPAGLRGATVGLLENRKHNAARFLEEVGRLLVERHGARELVLRSKGGFNAPVEEPLLEELARRCDVVVTGVGD